MMVGLLAMGSLASATTVSCPTPVLNVTTLTGSNNFACGGLTFSNFVVSPSTVIVGIGSESTLVGGNDVVLDLHLSGFTSLNVDTFLNYQVDGAITGVDMGFQAPTTTDGSNVRIFETVCKVAFDAVFHTCVGDGNTLANFSLVSSGAAVSTTVTFAQQSRVFIKKDIQFNGSSISDFNNSHLTGVPEPMTLSMMGLGLLGLGLMRRRQQGKK